ncbi:hypothetical protein K504DRAFT_456495 [Pleomassaria siparia CBS 279.74]|uniref:Uncharacterized protein n=1 Tax=Pleomassaria siparia CBS 279.74 TaxID=1314801 RepID=A0A6G1K6I8_9PLEO|nr:hypothetical protein K504DRAFT_456495 [Pleomassaria siparia CBS 279.74]
MTPPIMNVENTIETPTAMDIPLPTTGKSKTPAAMKLQLPTAPKSALKSTAPTSRPRVNMAVSFAAKDIVFIVSRPSSVSSASSRLNDTDLPCSQFHLSAVVAESSITTADAQGEILQLERGAMLTPKTMLETALTRNDPVVGKDEGLIAKFTEILAQVGQ